MSSSRSPESAGVGPVQPGDLVVLHVGVVVAALGAPAFVARDQHRGARREQQRADQVAGLAQPQRVHVIRRGIAFGAAVVGAVVVGAVAVLLAVVVVVLAVVGDEVAHGEAVVRRHEVDRRDRQPSVVAVEVGRAGQPERQVAYPAVAEGPERAHRVAVLAVPLRPQRRELTDLVAAVADVPGLGDQLRLADHRVLVDDVEERGQLVDACSDRASAEARSKRNPSTCISVIQYRSESVISCSGNGRRGSKVFPQPV